MATEELDPKDLTEFAEVGKKMEIIAPLMIPVPEPSGHGFVYSKFTLTREQCKTAGSKTGRDTYIVQGVDALSMASVRGCQVDVVFAKMKL